MKKTVYVAIAAALCLLAGCKEKELTEYEKGMEKLEQQKYEKAVRHFENAIEKGDSTEPVSYTHLDVYKRQGKLE